MGFKSAWLPHLELLAEADKSDVRSDAGVLPEPLRQNGAPVLIDRKDLACAEQSRGKVVALVRIGRQTFDKAVDFVHQPLAASVERRRIERRIAINAVKAILSEDAAERCRDRDSAFCVDLIGESRNKLVHLPLLGTWGRRLTNERSRRRIRFRRSGGRGGAVPRGLVRSA